MTYEEIYYETMCNEVWVRCGMKCGVRCGIRSGVRCDIRSGVRCGIRSGVRCGIRSGGERKRREQLVTS